MSKKIFIRLPEEKQKLIFELSKNPKYLHKKYLWRKKYKITLRNQHSPSGRGQNSNTSVMVRWKQLDNRVGKPNYKLIGKAVGTDSNTVKVYLLGLHSKIMENLRDKTLKINNTFENLPEEKRVKVMDKFCKKLLYGRDNYVGVRYPLKDRCEKCGKWYHKITGHRNHSKQYNLGNKKLCSRCLMSEIRKEYIKNKRLQEQEVVI